MNTILDQNGSYSKEITRDFFKAVYGYMFGALAISGIIAYMAGTPEFVLKYFMNASGTGPSATFYIVAFAPIGLGLLIQTMYRRLSFGLLLLLFLGYSVLMGLSLSVILLAFSIGQIAVTFFVAAGAFGGMAILGYTTKADLTKFGSLMYMLFIGIFIGSIVNMFVGSGPLDFVISIIGVFVFTGLTAYFMQKLKDVAQQESLTGLERDKLALVGGLSLYILFINLFLTLLRLLNRD
jgi:uncharacterized protein